MGKLAVEFGGEVAESDDGKCEVLQKGYVWQDL